MLKKDNNNLKIGIDIRNIGKKRTGSEIVVLELIKNILKIDKRNKYILLTDTDDEKIISYVKKVLEIKDKKNAEIVSVKASNKFIWASWSLPLWVHKNNLDIYHTEYILPFFMPKNTKLVTHIHDVSFKVYRKFILWKDILFLDILIPWTIYKADKIIAVSKFTRDEIKKYYPYAKGKIDIVYNATNPNKNTFREVSNKQLIKIKSKYNLPEKFILYIGTLQPRKNIPTLINAYAKIKNKIPEIKLVIAGDKNGYNFDKKIDIIIDKYNLLDQEVRFIGFVDAKDKNVVYSSAQVLVAPSFYEGFGITPLEAIKENTPVLISDIPVHREIYEDGAIYFNPKNIDNLAKKIYTICTNEELRINLVRQGFVRLSFFSWKKSAKKMLKIYKLLKS